MRVRFPSPAPTRNPGKGAGRAAAVWVWPAAHCDSCHMRAARRVDHASVRIAGASRADRTSRTSAAPLRCAALPAPLWPEATRALRRRQWPSCSGGASSADCPASPGARRGRVRVACGDGLPPPSTNPAESRRSSQLSGIGQTTLYALREVSLAGSRPQLPALLGTLLTTLLRASAYPPT
jgi:hypothetical protein